MFEMWGSALKSLLRRRARTLLTVLGIAVGVASVIIISAIGDTGKKAVNYELDSLGMNGLSVMSKTSGAPLQTEDLEWISSLPCVETAVPIVTGISQATYLDRSLQTIVWGIDSGAGSLISIETIHGRDMTKSDVQKGANICLIDANVSQSLFGRQNTVGQSVEIQIGSVKEKYEVVGVVKSDSGLLQNVVGEYIPSFIYLPYTNIQRNSGNSEITQIAVKVQENQNVDDAAKTIAASISTNKGVPDAVRTDNLAKQRDKLSNMMGIVTLALTSVAGISLVVAGIGITTMMLVSVQERTREIGIKKSIGATTANILMEFLAEAFLIATAGGAIGTAMALLLNYLLEVTIGFALTVTPVNILLSVGSAIFIGLVFGVYPARKASRLRPVDALRYE